MTSMEKQQIILMQLINNLSEFSNDHLELMTEICSSPEETKRWRKNRDLLKKVDDNINDFLLVRTGREPIFGSLKGWGSD